MRFVEGLKREEFERDDLHLNAVLWALEIVGEAAARVSQPTRGAHPEIPWEQMIGMRNRLIHEYFRIDLSIVWDTVHGDLPPLIAQLEPLIPPEDEV